MAVITPLPNTLSPRIQTPAPKAGPQRTVSDEEEEINNSRLLDNFLESCRDGTTPTHHLVIPAAANNTNSAPLSNPFTSSLLNLPLTILKQILRNLLLSPSPLILRPDSNPPITTNTHRTCIIAPSVLQTCKLLHNVGVPILYGENTLTASSPSTSFDFDAHLLALRGGVRQLITSVKLEIDWADGLWAKFPLVARALGEARGLRRLEVGIVVEKEEEKEKREGEMERRDGNGTALMVVDKDARLDIELASGCGQRYRPPEIITTTTATTALPPRLPGIDIPTDRRVEREGQMVADAMLKAEMKMFEDLVSDLKSLRWFRLRGFRDEAFARGLEGRVRFGLGNR